MKILHLINTLSAGGAELHLLTLCRHLKRVGVEVVVGYLKEGKESRFLQEDFERAGIRVVNLKGKRLWDGRCLWRAVQWVRQERPDLLHTHLPRADFVGFVIKALQPSLSWVFSSHDIYSRSWRGARLLPFFNVLWKRADRAIAISNVVKSWLVESYGLQEKKVEVIYYGIEPEQFSQPCRDLRQEWGLDENPTIGTIGRLEPRKGHDVLIRAMPGVLRHIPKATLLVAGHDPWGYGEHLQALIHSLGLNQRVRLVGFQEDIPSFLHTLDIFAFASRSEGFGQVLIEAMAAGKAVVASKLPPLTEIVLNGETGLLVEPDRPEEFVQAIINILNHPDKAQKMGRCGQERVYAKFSATRMAEETLALYRKLELGTGSYLLFRC